MPLFTDTLKRESKNVGSLIKKDFYKSRNEH